MPGDPHNLCLTPEDLFAAADSPSAVHESHLSTCAECRSAVEAIRADNALAAELAAAAARPSPASPPSWSGVVPTVILGGPHVDPSAFAPGTRIGHYTITSVLGVGGMGMVYRAEQDAPRRPVALKIIRPELASESLIRRFEHEAAALALLKHPGIAQVYEAGVARLSEPGDPSDPSAEQARDVPFFAMELVDGQRLDHLFRDHKPSRPETLRLVAALCDAVDHAHRRGVIHRDLKPANILVESGDATRQQPGPANDPSPFPRPSAPTLLPRILDFGVAKLRDPSLNIEATQPGGFVGTIAYAAPEQVAGLSADPAAIDARADVYALGVILYELIVGQRPYSLDGSLQTVVATVSAARIIAPESRGVRLDTDLRTIIYKALAADPDRRYQSAAALAEDIRRYLEKRPLRARPDSTLYTLRKAIARHPYRAAAAAAFALLIVVATTISISLLLRAAAADRLQASVSDSFLEAMRQADQSDDTTPAVSTVPALFEAFARSINDKLANHPRERAAQLFRLGKAVLSHRQYDQAISILSDVVALRREKSDPVLLADALQELGGASSAKGDLQSAEPLLREAYTLRTAALGPHHPDTVAALHDVGVNFSRWKRYPEAESIFREVVAFEQRASAADPKSPRLAMALNDLAAAIRPQGRQEEALDFAQQSLAELERVMGPEHKHIPVALGNVVANLTDLKRYKEAIVLATRARDIRLKLFGPDDPRIADSLIQLAKLRMSVGEFGETAEQQAELDIAAELANHTLDIRRRIHAGDHELIAETLSVLGQIRMRQSRFTDAIATLRAAMEMRARLPRRNDGDLGRSESLLGDCLRRAGRTADAEPLLRSGLEKIRVGYGAEHRHTREAQERLDALTAP